MHVKGGANDGNDMSANLLKDTIDDTIHRNDPEMTTISEDEIKVWGYLMTQYNLMPGLKKFGT
jgi:hypothetical protein